jgi:hypothetical protein
MAVPFTQLVASTYDAVVAERNKAADQWSDSSALQHLQKIGGVKGVAGGATLQLPLDYRQNPAADFLLVDTTQTSTAKTDILTAASYSWVPLVVPTNWTLYDEALNSDSNQKVDLAASIVDNMLLTHDQTIEAALFATTGGTDGFNTFVDLYTEDGTGTVGTIVAGTETWWANQFHDWDTDTGAALIASYTTLYNECAKGSSGRVPNVAFMNATLHGSLESAMVAYTQYVMTPATNVGNVGFRVLKFKGTVDVIFSSVITTAQDSAWMFNTEDTKLYYVRGAWRQRRGAIEHLNAAMMNQKLFSVCQLATKNRSRGGVMFT